MSDGSRQEVFNVLLAQLLNERGVVAAPEAILKAAPGRRLPDVLVEFNGLRTILEGEIADQPNAADRALAAARQRVEEGLAYIGVAVIYPAELRRVDYAELKRALAHSLLQIATFTEAGKIGFVTGTVNELERLLRETYQQLLSEDVVAQAVGLLDQGVEAFASVVMPMPGVVGRLAQLLEVRDPDHLSPEQNGAVSRIGGLILVNALIFHESLCKTVRGLLPLSEILKRNDSLILTLGNQWELVLQINYYSVFHVAERTLAALVADLTINDTFIKLVNIAHQLVRNRAALRRDLMGRVYHRLLAEAKYLGTYYTAISSAALLLKLTLAEKHWGADWHDLTKLRRVRVADLACGTGTLLMAAAESLTDNYVNTAADLGQTVDLPKLHQVLAENVIYGYDVLPSAIHLTASTLALRAPDVAYKKMNLFSLPLGGPAHKLGSLEFLKGRLTTIQMDLFGAFPKTEQVSGTGKRLSAEPVSALLPELDVCVMNPPFVRSVGGNLLFGSAPEAERVIMQRDLKKLLQEHHIPANTTAGLGAVFVAIADPYLKVGGRLALVLPKALLSGVAWEPTRRLLNQRYQLEYIIASHDPTRWNFSDSTDLSEVMVIARKIGPTPKAADPRQIKDKSAPYAEPTVTALNLWHNPPTSFETLALAYAVLRDPAPDLVTGQGALELTIGDRKMGEVVTLPWRMLRERNDWMLPAAFAQADLTRAAYHLAEGQLWLPGHKKRAKIPLCALRDLGTLGPDVRDLADGFKISRATTSYAAFWGHEAAEVYTLAQTPNQHLMPLPKALPGRNLRKAEDLWPLASRVLLAERLRLNSQRLSSVRLSAPVLSNSWWEFTFNKKIASQQREKILVLWLNSTLGLMMLILHRQETQGAWVKFKKPTLAAMPVLDLTALDAAQLRRLAAAYDRLSEQALLPLPHMRQDGTRQQIDAALAETLHLPDLTPLRQLLARESVVCLEALGGGAPSL
jgi:hypothetical protein